MIPQIIYLVIIILGTGINLAKHGEQKNDKYNIWTHLLSVVIILFILYKGGFFNCFIK